MTIDEITAIIDKSTSGLKLGMKITLGIGIACLAGASVCYFAVPDAMRAVKILGILGGLAVVIGPLLGVAAKGNAQQAALLRNTLTNNPDTLVWGYVYEEMRKGVKNVEVRLCVRNEAVPISISDYSLPNKDTQGFLRMLKEKYNPNMLLGYSEEAEYKFNKKLL
ncbi:MAG: hypothetical protein U0V74_08130 [Chitinophagales bacterium]